LFTLDQFFFLKIHQRIPRRHRSWRILVRVDRTIEVRFWSGVVDKKKRNKGRITEGSLFFKKLYEQRLPLDDLLVIVFLLGVNDRMDRGTVMLGAHMHQSRFQPQIYS
jgi:hypothetical protein